MNPEKKLNKKEVKYKYLIHHLLNILPHHKYKITSRYLPRKLGISAETFRKWKYIKLNDSATIPADKLAIIAIFFEIRIEEIFNYDIPVLSFEELEEEERMSEKKN